MVMRGEHLASDLGVARLVGPDEAELIPAEVGHEAVEEEVAAEDKKDEYFADVPAKTSAKKGSDTLQRREGVGRVGRNRLWRQIRGESFGLGSFRQETVFSF
jgi:hypothetical protein